MAIYASVVKLVDTTDSKSVAFKSVSVRVRPLVPTSKTLENTTFQGFFIGLMKGIFTLAKIDIFTAFDTFLIL